jgi:hypothetical protein
LNGIATVRAGVLAGGAFASAPSAGLGGALGFVTERLGALAMICVPGFFFGVAVDGAGDPCFARASSTA